MWKKQATRPLPEKKTPPEVEDSMLDFGFFDKTCA
jgi:hypothetical protein